MILQRVILSAVLATALSVPAAGGGRAKPAMQAAFDVLALGFKVGELSMTGRVSDNSYEVLARFGTTGLIRLFKDMGFSMRSSGRRNGAALMPRDYAEQVNTGSRRSSARMHYRDGVPELLGGEVGDGEVAPLDPATQGGTIDPLTALFRVLRDQAMAELCDADMQVFDGGRRSRVLLTGRSVSGDEVTCTGQFRRIAGYPPDELERRRVVPLTIRYAPAGNGMMRAQTARLHTVYGPVGLRRRE